MSQEEFVDDYRAIEADYHLWIEQMESMEIEDFLGGLEDLMKEDPYFLDSHLLMSEILFEMDEPKKARKILNDACDRAIELITDEDGNWPESMRWGFTENRHIIRAILKKAVDLWDQKKSDAALELLRKLLRSNPSDNVGARHYILAIRLGMSHKKFEMRFDKGGYYDNDLEIWFDKNVKKYPDEFDWWLDTIE